MIKASGSIVVRALQVWLLGSVMLFHGTLAQAQVEQSDGQASVLFIVDTSGSMRGFRIAQAKQALTAAIDAVPISQPVGLRSYAGGCGNGGILRVPVGVNNRQQFQSAVDALFASGGTPTPDALIAGISDLPEDPDGRIIVLISDGQSSCGDPCPIAGQLLADADIQFTINTVGFQTTGNAEAQLQCLADITDGTYIPASDADGIIDAISDALDKGLLYNQVQQKSSHNAYVRSEPLLDQLIYHRIRSLELDLKNEKKRKGQQIVPPLRDNDWYVHHGTGAETSLCTRLTDCLDELRAFHEAVPDHEVVTIFSDLKDSFEPGRMPQDLDAILTSDAYLGDAVLTPGELMAKCDDATDLVSSVTGDCSWPSLNSLRGRFIFVFTDNTDRLNQYLAEGGQAAFIAPKTSSFDTSDMRDDVIFYNVSGFKDDLIRKINAAGLVSRAYKFNDDNNFQKNVRGETHHIATDRVNYLEDPGIRTHNNLGWPFVAIDGNTPVIAENGPYIRVDVASGDIDGDGDDFRFDYQFVTGESQWTVAVSTMNSKAPEDTAKGCLMARAGLADDAPFVAVCRYADDNPLHMLVREDSGDNVRSLTIKDDLLPSSTEDNQEVHSFVGLHVVPINGRTCVTTSGGLSLEGKPGSLDPGLQPLADICIDGTLSYQGIATASKDKNDPTFFIYTGLNRDDLQLVAEDLQSEDISDASGATFDGVAPGAIGKCENTDRGKFQDHSYSGAEANLSSPETFTLSWTPNQIYCGDWIVIRDDSDAFDAIINNRIPEGAPNDWWFDIVDVIGSSERPELELSVFDFADGEEVCFTPILMDDIGFVGSYLPAFTSCYVNTRPQPVAPPDISGPTSCTVQGAGGWAMRAQISWDDGLILEDVRLGPRMMAERLSVPYVSVDYQVTDNQQLFGNGEPYDVTARIELGADRTQRAIPGTNIIPHMQRVTPLTCNVTDDQIKISTSFRIEMSGDASDTGPLLERTIEQSYVFEIDRTNAGDICEPSEDNIPCFRWWPQVTYTNPTNSAIPMNELGVVQRFDFTIDGIKNNVQEILDANIRFSNPFQPEEKVLKDREMFFIGIPGFQEPGDPTPENLHQTSRDEVSLPGVLGVLPGITQTPGCAECVHIHWKWPNLVDAGGGDFTDGDPHVPDGSDQSLTVGVSIDKPGELDPDNFMDVFNSEKSIDGNDLVSWFAYSSDHDEDQFWPIDRTEEHGGSGAAFFTPTERFRFLAAEVLQDEIVETDGIWEVPVELDPVVECKGLMNIIIKDEFGEKFWRGPFYLTIENTTASLLDADAAYNSIPLGTPFRKMYDANGNVMMSLGCDDLPLRQTLKFDTNPGANLFVRPVRSPARFKGEPYSD